MTFFLFCSFWLISLILCCEGTEILIPFVFEGTFFMLANTSSECDCTNRNLLLVLQFLALFREQMEGMAKALFPGETASLLT